MFFFVFSRAFTKMASFKEMSPPCKCGPNFHTSSVKFCCEQDLATHNYSDCLLSRKNSFDLFLLWCKGGRHRRGRQSGRNDRNLTAHYDTMTPNVLLHAWQLTSEQNPISHIYILKKGTWNFGKKSPEFRKNWGDVHTLFVSLLSAADEPQLCRSQSSGGGWKRRLHCVCTQEASGGR